MPEVELILRADNSQYVNEVRKAQQANQELHNAVERNRKREKGLIEDIENTIKRYEEGRRKATSVADIEKYNKKLVEAKRDLDEYTKAGVKAEKQTDSLTKSIGKWALSLGGVTAALAAVKKAILNTTTGINLFNIAGQVAQQVMYNLVTNATSLYNGLTQVISAQRTLNELRLSGKVAEFGAAEQQIIFNEALIEAHDQMLTGAERITAYDRAIEANTERVKILREEYVKEAIALKKIIDARKDSEKEQLRYADIMILLRELEASEASRLKEISSMRSGLVKAEIEERRREYEKYLKWVEDEYYRKIDEFNKLALKMQTDYDEAMIESLSGYDKLKAQEDYSLKQLELFRKQIEEVGKLTPEMEKQFQFLAGQIHRTFLESMEFAPAEIDNITQSMLNWMDILLPEIDVEAANKLKEYKGAHPQREGSIWNLIGIDPESDQGSEMIDSIKEVFGQLFDAIDNLFDKRVEDARRTRELYDRQVSDLQTELSIEAELMEAGYANNVDLKRKELEELKKQRNQALAEEEKAIQKQRIMEASIQAVNMVTTVSELLKNFSKIPLVGLALAGVAIASMWAMFSAAKTKTTEMTKLAEGGYGDETGVIKGKSHAAGGERFLSHVEVERGERWGVLNRKASDRFGRTFDTIVSSFNRGEMPQFLTPENVNNITVENNGPNTRLDRVIAEQRKLNDKFGKGSQMIIVGGKRIITKGNKVRIVG